MFSIRGVTGERHFYRILPMNDGPRERPVGFPLPGWRGARLPVRERIEGRFVAIEPLDAQMHGDDLYESVAPDVDGALWTYMPAGPFSSKKAFCSWLETVCAGSDPLFYAIVDLSTGTAVGMAAYMRIRPDIGVIEIGNILYSPALQRTRGATEAMFLFMQTAFDELGYRRYEWKCDSLNSASRKAAARLGFRYDGLFEQALVYKGRNRDTAWYSILDRDWPALKAAYSSWLDPDNFDPEGHQKLKLSDLVAATREG